MAALGNQRARGDEVFGCLFEGSIGATEVREVWLTASLLSYSMRHCVGDGHAEEFLQGPDPQNHRNDVRSVCV